MNSIKLLEKYNPWWKFKKVPKALLKIPRKKQMEECIKSVSEKQILVIEGLKGTGKAALIFNIIDHLIKKNIDAEKIILVDIDKSDEKINELIKNYIKDRFGKEITEITNDIYVFLLNVQYIKNIEDEIKEFLPVINIKIIISTSLSDQFSRFGLKKNAGIIAFQKIYPLSFPEYLSSHKPNLSNPVFNLKNILDFEFFKNRLKSFIKHENKIKPFYRKFLTSGALYDFIEIDEPIIYKNEIKSKILDSIIFKDMHLLFDVKYLSQMAKIYSFLCSTSTEVSNQLKISNKFKISYPSILNYLKYFEKSFLLNSTRNYYAGTTNEKRTNRKLFVGDIGFIDNLEENHFVKAKSLIFNHCYRIVRNRGWEMYYWQHFRYSIEILLCIGDLIVPIDISKSSFIAVNNSESIPDKISENSIKDSDNIKINEKDLKGLLKLLIKNKLERGVLITKNEFEIRKYQTCEIMMIPVWMFLLSE